MKIFLFSFQGALFASKYIIRGGNQMEIVIIGGIAAGMSVAAKAKRTNKAANVTVIEKEP